MKLRFLAVFFAAALLSALSSVPARAAGLVIFENRTTSDVQLKYHVGYACQGSSSKDFTLPRNATYRMPIPEVCAGSYVSQLFSDGTWKRTDLQCGVDAAIGKHDNHYIIRYCTGQPIDGCWSGVKSDWTCN